MALGIWASIPIFYVPFFSLDIAPNGKVFGMWECGLTSYFCLFFVVTAQVCLMTNHWTAINFLAVGGTIAGFILFILLYCNAMWLDFDAYGVVYIVASSPVFYASIILVVVMAVLPQLFTKAIKQWMSPDMSHRIRRNVAKGHSTVRTGRKSGYNGSKDATMVSDYRGYAFSQEKGHGVLATGLGVGVGAGLRRRLERGRRGSV
eukprot:TRINITY_DN2435_c0_g1_i1.p1 TRINITY_DN2435_c0_g1~~TRINITY_DN2435_c0_g1_i1.p1  ORF type:complete len:204 (-),score=42.82 TRINITY_DN2435_c0_g1_i1:29-640(-)